MAKYYTNTEELELIADAIREKGETNAQLTFPNEFVSAIKNLPTGGGTVVTGNDVVFYDYDGTIVVSYSASAFSQLSKLPANPTHIGLVAQGWNWSLANAKTYVAKHGKLNIGQMYTTESGATEIDVIMQEGRLEPILTICVDGTITVDWGDNTTPDTVTGTSLSTRQARQHTYAQAGAYTISISATGSNQYKFYGSSAYALLRKNMNGYENTVYINTIQHIRIGSNAAIGSSSFQNCHSLKSITIPDTVTSIGDQAFYCCYSLASITIPNGVTSIENNTFLSCYSLSSVLIPDTMTSIGTQAFQNCYSLASIIMPDTITSIGNSAFYYCCALTSFTIPDSVTSIGNNMFHHCFSLASITIPDTVTNIGNSAFYLCHSLASITIPGTVTSIGNSAFHFCYSLASITIPDTVTSIGKQTFNYCCGIKEYHILPTTPPTGTTIFNNIPPDCVIYVPSASLETYKTAENWSDYARYMQGE